MGRRSTPWIPPSRNPRSITLPRSGVKKRWRRLETRSASTTRSRSLRTCHRSRTIRIVDNHRPRIMLSGVAPIERHPVRAAPRPHFDPTWVSCETCVSRRELGTSSSRCFSTDSRLRSERFRRGESIHTGQSREAMSSYRSPSRPPDGGGTTTTTGTLFRNDKTRSHRQVFSMREASFSTASHAGRSFCHSVGAGRTPSTRLVHSAAAGGGRTSSR